MTEVERGPLGKAIAKYCPYCGEEDPERRSTTRNEYHCDCCDMVWWFN
jgi:hypothetical protein